MQWIEYIKIARGYYKLGTQSKQYPSNWYDIEGCAFTKGDQNDMRVNESKILRIGRLSSCTLKDRKQNSYRRRTAEVWDEHVYIRIWKVTFADHEYHRIEEAENAIDVDGLINFEHRHKPRGWSAVRIMTMTTTKTKFRTSFAVDVVYRKIRQLALGSYHV